MTRIERRREIEAERKAADEAAEQAMSERVRHCWQVPERAKADYLDLEDLVGVDQAKAILNLMVSLYGEPAG